MTPQDNTPQFQSLAPVSEAVTTYLKTLDEHLTKVPSARERMKIIDGERYRCDRIERSLSDWALLGNGDPPTRFSAWDLAVIHGELSVRFEAARDRVEIQEQRT